MKGRVWYDTKLKKAAGVEYRQKIEEQIGQAQIAILLLSQNLLTSDFIKEFELPQIKDKVIAGRMSIIPILVGPISRISWNEEEVFKWLRDRQIIPGKPTPLLDYAGDMKKWEDVKIEILDACMERINEIRKIDSPLSPHPTRSLSTDGASGRWLTSIDLENSPTEPRKEYWGIPEILRNHRITIALFAILLTLFALRHFLFLGSGPVADKNGITSAALSIVEPKNGASLPSVITVRGTASRNVKVWLIVHPTATSEYWVQAKVERYSDGEWLGEIHLGSRGSADRGKSFEVLAVAEPEKYLEEGMVLNGWPVSRWRSNIILVSRE